VSNPQPAQQGLRRGMKSATVVGIGNVGSPLIPQLARLPALGRVTLVDFDVYEEKNLASQDIAPRDVGRPKVEVQARRLRRIAPWIEVEPIPARVEDVPLGRLRADVILAGLDSRIARRWVNQAAWRLGVPWIDGGVDGAGLLVRVNAYRPGPGAPCMECGWDPADYEAETLEQPYPCNPEAGNVAPTNAPACVGNVAAGLIAVECHKVLSGDAEHFVHGRQILIDLRNQKHYLTRYDPDPNCQFDHESWDIEPLDESPAGLTVAQIIRMAAGEGGECPGWSLGVEGQTFGCRQYCANCCKTTRDFIYMTRRIPPARSRCATCGGPLQVRGFDMVESLELPALSGSQRRRSLRSLGLRPGDVVTIRHPAAVRHFELGVRPASHPGEQEARQPAGAAS